jgi:MFS family permease
MDHKAPVNKNFRLVLIGAFFQAFVFWYAIEKLFLLSINLTNFEIGFVVALTSITVLLFEFPSGVLADRWSRKGTLILASLALVVADVLGYFSNDLFVYSLQVICWGIFYAMQSGVYSALTYDMLLENKLAEAEYDQYYGKVRITEGLALIIAAISGGALAEIYGLRAMYAVSIPTAILSMWVFFRIREPKIHKTDANQLSAWQHIGGVIRYIKDSNFLMLSLLQLILITVIFTLGFEFAQLYYVAIGLPVVFFGLGNASVTGAFTFGGFLAHWLRKRSGQPFKLLLLTAPFIALLQFIIRGPWGFLAPAILLTVFIAMDIRFGRILHGQLPSKYRASVTSLSSTFGRLFAVPLALLFGWLVGAESYYDASLIITGVVIAALIIGIWILNNPKAKINNNKLNKIAKAIKL